MRTPNDPRLTLTDVLSALEAREADTRRTDALEPVAVLPGQAGTARTLQAGKAPPSN